jgi:pullulanase/glycogen debranching enzyme
MDIVFNHTAGVNENGHILSFRGIDNITYYMLALAPNVKYIIHCVFTLHESKYSFLM